MANPIVEPEFCEVCEFRINKCECGLYDYEPDENDFDMSDYYGAESDLYDAYRID